MNIFVKLQSDPTTNIESCLQKRLNRKLFTIISCHLKPICLLYLYKYNNVYFFRYFLQEIQMGETLIARGDFESGVEHLANAIVVCGQPARLLQVLQSSLPAQVFAMLIIKMQEFGEGKVGPGSRSNPVDNQSIQLDNAGPAIIDDLE